MVDRIISPRSVPLVSETGQTSLSELRPTPQPLPLAKETASKARLRKFKNESVTQKNLRGLQAQTAIEKAKVKNVQTIPDESDSEELVALENGIKFLVKWYDGSFRKDEEVGLLFQNEGKELNLIRYRDGMEIDRIRLTHRGNNFYS